MSPVTFCPLRHNYCVYCSNAGFILKYHVTDIIFDSIILLQVIKYKIIPCKNKFPAKHYPVLFYFKMDSIQIPRILYFCLTEKSGCKKDCILKTKKIFSFLKCKLGD